MDKQCRPVNTKAPDPIRKRWSNSERDPNSKGKSHKPGSPTTSPTPAAGPRVRPSSVSMDRFATMVQIGQDWLYLALLGIIMALLSFSMDAVISLFLDTRLRLFEDVSSDFLPTRYLAWCVMPIVLVSFSSGFVHLCSPTVSTGQEMSSSIDSF